MDRVMIDLYSLILLLRHDPEPIRDIISDDFWYDHRTQYEPNTKLEGYSWEI
jgi:hypothetical protein